MRIVDCGLQKVTNESRAMRSYEFGIKRRRTADRDRLTIRNPQSAIRNQRGFTLLEIIIVITILSVLTAAAIPMVRNSVRRQREEDLRVALRQLRQAIDRYKEFHDRTQGGAI